LPKDVSDEELRLFPVENVSWDDAQVFITKLNERERGKAYRYRLPMQDEWEYACRGGVASEEECSSHFYFDRPTNDLSSHLANFNGNYPYGQGPKGPFLGRPMRVGAYPPNRLGLCDMHGNVGQWCEEPSPGSTDRVSRGGGYSFHGDDCRASIVVRAAPTDRLNFCGFRLARVAVR
jgi:formylglycine-generating enzyme required for sulfatase activity